MDELRNLLGEFFFTSREGILADMQEEAMRYPRKYASFTEFQREELGFSKINWSIDDFFDEVFLGGEMDLGFGNCDVEEDDEESNEFVED